MIYSDKEIEYAPTLRPTLKEFSNFREYVFKLFVNPKYANAGCVKVIPPVQPGKNCFDIKSFIKNN